MPVVQNPRTRLSTRRVVCMAVVESLESRQLLAATIYVDSLVSGGLHDGTTWNNAYANLRDAITAARSGDNIRIAGGTYRPTDGTVQPPGGPDRTLTFMLKWGVGIYGGYAGSAYPANPDTRELTTFRTILSGDIGIRGNNTDNSYHVVTAAQVNGAAVLDGVTITGGNANAVVVAGASFNNVGGGMLVRLASPTIRNCTFDTNNALDGGGGLLVDHSSVTVIGSTFTHNTSPGSSALTGLGGGAGIQYSTGNCTFDRCTFVTNTAKQGGGVYAIQGSLVVSNSTFTTNSATVGGGAVSLGDPLVTTSAATATISNTIFKRNSAPLGGAIQCAGNSAITLAADQFPGNSATTNGGALYLDSIANSTVTNCLFVGNITTGLGGAIYNGSKGVVVGQLLNASTALTMTNSTLAYNTAQGAAKAGGGIYNLGCSPTIANCILWGDVGGEITNVNYASGGGGAGGKSAVSLPIVSFSDIQGGWTSTTVGTTNNVNTNPQFLITPGPGVDNKWGTADDNYGDLRLKPASPVVDAANTNAVPPGTTTDLAGNPRFVDAPNPPGTTDTGGGPLPYVDMGAYETPALWPVSFDIAKQSVLKSGGSVTLTATLITPLWYDVTVPLLFGGTATPGEDYTIPSTPLTISAGNTSGSVVIPIIDDHLYDAETTIVVDMGVLSTAVPGNIAEQAIRIINYANEPVLNPIADQVVNYTNTLSVQASTSNPVGPDPSLIYTLDGVVPAGASITPAGLFTWTPLLTTSAGVYNFTIRVSSINNPALFSTQSFNVQRVLLPSTLSGTLFHDPNRNNQVDAGEEPLAGWTVFADLNNNGIADGNDPSTVTDANGHWEITGVAPAGIHVVTVAPAGWLPTIPAMANLPVNIPSGQTLILRPVGFYRIVNYTGSVFQDANLNGQIDAGEVGLAGSTVWADLNGNGLVDAGEPSAITGTDGVFALNGLTEDPVLIRATTPSGWVITNYPNGYATPVIAAGEQPAPINFAAAQVGSVSGSVYDDANGNGVRDPGERGFANATVWLDLNNNGVRDPGEPSATTDGAGQFMILGVPAGTYNLRTTAQPGYVFTSPANGVLDVTRTGAAPSTGNNFVLRRPSGSVSGRVFIDANSDGVRQPAEKPRAGLRVFLDANGNGALDPGELSTYSSARGQFVFGNVPIGSYSLVSALPAGYRFTTDNSGVFEVSLGSSTTQDIGIAPFASVKGRVFLDNNRNGRLDAGDKAMANRRVFIDANGNGVLDPGEVSVLTDSQGFYSLNSLAAGTYTIRLVALKGYKTTSPAKGAHVVTVAAGQIGGGRNFVVVKG